MKVAAIHFGKDPEIALNEKRLFELNIRASEEGADLIVNPELSVLAFNAIKYGSTVEIITEGRKFARYFAEEICHKLVKRFHEEITRRYSNHLVLGIITVVPEYNLLYNSAVLIGPGGGKTTYNKRFLTADAIYACQGSTDLIPTKLKGGNVGMTLCADYAIPLIARSLVLNDSDIIVIPAHLSASTVDTLKVRAMENGIPLVLANAYDYNDTAWFRSQSAIVSADGQVIASHDENKDKVLYADLDLSSPEAAKLKRNRISRRRPHLYQGALLNLSQIVKLDKKPQAQEVILITISGDEAKKYLFPNYLASLVEESGQSHLPVIVILPDLLLKKEEIEMLKDFARTKNIYMVCGYTSDKYKVVSLFLPNGDEKSYKQVHLSDADKSKLAGDILETHVDLPFGKISILAGEDLLIPEALEIHRNLGVDLILVASSLDFDAAILFHDIAKGRHINIAVAENKFRGGIYSRDPNKTGDDNKNFVNKTKIDITKYKSDLNISPRGLEIVVKT